MIVFLAVYYFISTSQYAGVLFFVFFLVKCHFFFLSFFGGGGLTQLGPIWTRLCIITIINNCQSAASARHSGRLISMAQHLFCEEADYFLQQAGPITLAGRYHINQNLTRWQM